MDSMACPCNGFSKAYANDLMRGIRVAMANTVAPQTVRLFVLL